MNSSQLIPTLLTEIIIQILLKLPVESLLRCKSVCKEWYSLISDEHFIKTHYTLSSSTTNNINYQHHRLVFNTFDETNKLISCPLYDVLFNKSVSCALEVENPLQRTQPPLGLQVVGSCNGLICLFVQDDDDDYDLFLYNPSTRVCNGLPIRLRNDDDCEPQQYSFGYDESTNDYKIVEISTTNKVNMYSLKTGKWKKLGDLSYTCPFNGFAKFLNGALHWMAFDDTPTPVKIVSLDLANETYGEVLQPVYYGKGDMCLTLGVLGDSLCVLSDYFGNHMDLWVMKDYGVKDSWTKLASFSYVTNDWVDPFIVPLFILNDGKVLFKCFIGLVIYDSKDSSVSCIQDFKFYEACIVVESLVSPVPPLGLANNSDDEN